MKLESVPSTAMDPRLQCMADRSRRGFRPAATAASDQGEIAVIARVKDFEAWRAMTEVRTYQPIARAADGVIVTGRIPLSRVEAVRSAPGVLSLKPAQTVRPALEATVREIHARQTDLPQPLAAAAGKGVVVGIVDFGCDFAHRNFRNQDGSTRLLAFWNQGEPAAGPGSPFGYGRLYEAKDIDAALQKKDPYEALGYRPGPGAHGSHVMDIAAGNGRGTGVPGVAPAADLAFVQIAADDVPWSGPDVVGKAFGDSVQLLEALRFIFDRAGSRPCVVNVSLGTNGGPHDGTSLVEQGIDALVAEKPNRAVVIAASNSFADGIHAAGTVASAGRVDVRWEVAVADSTENEMEIWYSKDDEFGLEIIDPSGASAGSVPLGQSARARDAQGQTQLFAAHRKADPNNGDNVIGLFLAEGAPRGVWTLRLTGRTVVNGAYHAWIERDDDGQSTFQAPQDNSHTLGSISCGKESIVVGSYDAHRADTPLSWFSSAGPTRDGRHKPEVSAPGHDVWAALSESGDGSTRMSGTSMASPATTGTVALMLSAAHAGGLSLSIAQVRTALTTTARRMGGTVAWDARYGEGRIDALAAVQVVNQQAAAVAALAGPAGQPALERRKTPRAPVARGRAAAPARAAAKR
jgi:subtilisin family serine protease